MTFSRPIVAIRQWIRKIFKTDQIDSIVEEALINSDLTSTNSNNNSIESDTTFTSKSSDIPKPSQKRDTPHESSNSTTKPVTQADSIKNQFPQYVRLLSTMIHSTLWCKKVLGLTKGLKTLKYDKLLGNEKKKILSISRLKQKAFRKEDWFKLKYFKDTENLKFVDDFQAFNPLDFQAIRNMLGVDDDQFKQAFDQFNKKKDKTFNVVLSSDGKFKLRFLAGEKAYFLHRNINKFKKYLADHPDTAILPYLGLYRVGNSFITIEYVDGEETRCRDKYYLMMTSNVLKVEVGYYNKNCLNGQRCPSDYRISRIPRLFTPKNSDQYKQVLLDDIKFLRKISPCFFKLTVGRREE